MPAAPKGALLWFRISKIPLPPPVITQQPQAARLLVRIAVAEGSSLIVQRNGPVQIARDAAARLIAFRKAAQCLHVALLRCARIKLRGTRRSCSTRSR